MSDKFKMEVERTKDSNIARLKKIHTCWETTGKLEDLIEQAEDCVQFLEQNSVGYYYMWMLLELKKIKKNK